MPKTWLHQSRLPLHQHISYRFGTAGQGNVHPKCLVSAPRVPAFEYHLGLLLSHLLEDMVVWLILSHLQEPLMSLSRGRLKYKKGRMMRTSLLLIQLELWGSKD